MASILTIDNQVMCPHGGQAILVTSNSAFLVEGSPALLETDLPTIAGCPFIIGLVYSPCVLIEWTAAAETLTVDGAGVVLETSIGLCSNAAGAPQGVAIIADATPAVDAV
jgi:hypothetical protein